MEALAQATGFANPRPRPAELVAVVLLGMSECGHDFGGGILLSERELFLDKMQREGILDPMQRRICERLFAHGASEQARLAEELREEKKGK